MPENTRTSALEIPIVFTAVSVLLYITIDPDTPFYIGISNSIYIKVKAVY